MKRLKAGHYVMLAGAVLLIAALSLAVWNWYESSRSGEIAAEIREELKSALSAEEIPDSRNSSVFTTVVPVQTQQTTTTVQSFYTNAEDSMIVENAVPQTTTRPVIADAWEAYTTEESFYMADAEETWCEIDGEWYIGLLSIPSLQVELPIFNLYVYDQLRYTPCRYAGSYLTDNLIIAAHNYNTHFGKIRQLDSGDLVDFTDMAGNVYHYQVMQTEILSDTATTEMEAGDWDLTLFTCTLSGAERVTVRCDRITAS